MNTEKVLTKKSRKNATTKNTNVVNTENTNVKNDDVKNDDGVTRFVTKYDTKNHSIVFSGDFNRDIPLCTHKNEFDGDKLAYTNGDHVEFECDGDIKSLYRVSDFALMIERLKRYFNVMTNCNVNKSSNYAYVMNSPRTIDACIKNLKQVLNCYFKNCKLVVNGETIFKSSSK